MDFSATIDLIIKDLKEASDIIEDLKKYPGVPALQVELAKMKCKSAGEVIAMLKTMKDYSPAAEKEPVLQKKVQKQTPREENKPLVVPDNVPPVIKVTKTEVPPFEIEPQVILKESEPTKILNIEQESSILADKFSHLSNSFNEKLASLKSDEEIADILKTKPLTTLSEAIGVNDKFLFIREIFNGNQNDYVQALSRLEIAENLTDARAVIMSYTGDNIESDAVKQLLDLMKRKLPSNE
jgi:hypothetical protein